MLLRKFTDFTKTSAASSSWGLTRFAQYLHLSTCISLLLPSFSVDVLILIFYTYKALNIILHGEKLADRERNSVNQCFSLSPSIHKQMVLGYILHGFSAEYPISYCSNQLIFLYWFSFLLSWSLVLLPNEVLTHKFSVKALLARETQVRWTVIFIFMLVS